MTFDSPLIVRPRLLPVTANARAKLGVSGSIVLTKLGRGGERLPVRVDKNRRAFQKVWEHHQTNLITDAGLNSIPSAQSAASMLDYIAVGTGSTAPDQSDVALDNEIARTNADLSLGSNDREHVSNGHQRFTRRVAFNFNEANGNLTEFGGFSVASSGSANTRDLFRDAGGNPITITKTSDEQLAIAYALDLTYAPTTLTSAGTVNIAGYAIFDLEHMFYRGYGLNTATDQRTFVATFENARVAAVTSFSAAYDDAAPGTLLAGRGQNSVTSTSPGSGQSVLPYVPNSYEREYRTQLTAGSSDDPLAGFILRRYAGGSDRFAICGWKFDDPASLLLNRDYRLQLNAKLVFARA